MSKLSLPSPLPLAMKRETSILPWMLARIPNTLWIHGPHIMSFGLGQTLANTPALPAVDRTVSFSGSMNGLIFDICV